MAVATVVTVNVWPDGKEVNLPSFENGVPKLVTALVYLGRCRLMADLARPYNTVENTIDFPAMSEACSHSLFFVTMPIIYKPPKKKGAYFWPKGSTASAIFVMLFL